MEKGGISLLNIQVHNEAIDFMWLKMFLSNDRPAWAFIANILIENCIAKSNNINKTLTSNMFTQSWPPATNGKYDLPTNLRRMISIAKKYNISLDILVIPKDVKKTYLLGTTVHYSPWQNIRHGLDFLPFLVKIVENTCNFVNSCSIYIKNSASKSPCRSEGDYILRI